MTTFRIILFFLAVPSCSVLHHYQVADIDSRAVLKGKRFEVMVNEFGFNLDEAASVAKMFARNQKQQKNVQTVRNIISLFQMGPRTGNTVLRDDFADRLFGRIRDACPKGKIAGITSIRETAKYPVISGEIVKIVGYCLRKRRSV